MKLINEYTTKIIVMIISLILFLEICIVIYTYLDSKKIFESTYEETLKASEKKAIEITRNIKMLTTNILMQAITELKLIAKHSLLYNKENSKNSKFFENNNKHKKIIKADIMNLFMDPTFYKIYKDTGQLNPSGYPDGNSNLNYLNYYHQAIFEKENNNNDILNKLLHEHDELNYISYHYFGKNTSYNINDDKDKERLIKYLVIILKSIYIKKLISKKEDTHIIRFLILNNKDLFIYPPEDYRKINLAQFRSVNPLSGCLYTSGNLDDYPSCIYKYLDEHLFPEATNYILVIKEYTRYEKISAGLCLQYKFNKEENDKSIICTELDFSSLIQTIKLSNLNLSKKFEFGLYKNLNFDGSMLGLPYDLKDIFIIVDNHFEIYNELFKTYNNKETTPLFYLLNDTNNWKPLSYFSLYHFMYFNVTKTLAEHPELNYNISKLEEEFIYVREKLFEIEKEFKNGNKRESYNFTFKRTICRKKILGNDYECLIDECLMIIFPLIININKLNEEFIEIDIAGSNHYDLWIYSIISTYPKSNEDNIKTIIKIKLIRITCLFTFFTLILLSFFILFINIFSEYSLGFIYELNNIINEITIDDKKKEISFLSENKNRLQNKEMLNLKDIYEILRKCLIIKHTFNKEFYLSQHILDFYYLVQDIKRKNIKEICNSFLAYFHFSKNNYNLAEKEFNSVINFIRENENKLDESNIYDDKLKDTIQRSCTVSYLNEYSTFENIDENILDIIYMKIFKQRFIYLYAMTKYKLGNENNNENNAQNNIGGTNKNKKNKERKVNYLKDAIKCFEECHNINILLGINKIKAIYSLIMITKCYIQLNDYKNAIININEALSLYFQFSETFTKYHSKNYNPKIMLFVESNIFHYILYTISQICIKFNKPCASNWIILKIFETTPFFLSNIHYYSGINLFNFLEKNKTKMNKYEPNFYKVENFKKVYERLKKYSEKIVSRLAIKNSNKNLTKKKFDDSNYNISFRKSLLTESVTGMSKLSSNLKKEMTTSKISSIYRNQNRKLNKIITLCLSEKILEKINGEELKDVLIKYFQKYFIMNENDKFSFIQFANNGKKSVSIQLESLNNFLLKIQKNKIAFTPTELFKVKDKSIFMELYSILDSIIKNYPQIEETDNIIFIFMDSEDIRFSTVEDCLNIVENLYKKNTSVYFFSFEEDIKEKKINNIQSFLNGLIEGYFFQINNYQQIKEIFINISSGKYYTNFLGYDYEIFEHIL